MKNKVLVLLSACAFLLNSCYNVRINEVEEWGDIFEKNGLEGAFEIYDNNKEINNYYNLELCSKQLPPGQTFYLLTSLIAIETSAVADENKVSKWLKEFPSEHYSDSMTLRQAFNEQNNDYFITLHNRINPEYYTQYYDSIAYGNKLYAKGDIWSKGPVLISLDEQIGLVKRIYHNKLKFVSERTSTIVRSMLLKEDKEALKVYEMTARVKIDNEDYVYIIGIIENYNPLKNPKTERIENIVHPYFFGLLVKSKSGSITQDQAQNLLSQLLDAYQVNHK